MQVHLGARGEKPAACALTIGNFDGVHLGHQSMLAQLRQYAQLRQLPTALLTFEPHPREVFARQSPPARLATLRDKLGFLAETGLVDHVFVYRFTRAFSALPAEDFIQRILCDTLHTRYLLIGDDFRFGAKRTGDFAQLAACPVFETQAMSTISLLGERISSSRIRHALAEGDFAHAQALLGRSYQISGHVMHGKKLGRTLGYPTANVHLPHRRPALNGVFVVEADTPFGTLGGVASLGLNPTVESDDRYKLEVHLFDFNGNLYGTRMAVRFLAKLRDEQKFDSLAALTAQIAADADAARHFLSISQKALA